MSMLEVLKTYQPVENPEFGAKKKLVGDAVAQVTELARIISKKNQSEWLVLKSEVIHAIPDPKGRETTVQPGDKIEILYNPNDQESVQDLANDLFTAGIEYSKKADTEDGLIDSISEAVKGKLVYFRTWAKDKPEAKREPGKPDYYQNIVVKSKNLITPENSVPQLPF